MLEVIHPELLRERPGSSRCWHGGLQQRALPPRSAVGLPCLGRVLWRPRCALACCTLAAGRCRSSCSLGAPSAPLFLLFSPLCSASRHAGLPVPRGVPRRGRREYGWCGGSLPGARGAPHPELRFGSALAARAALSGGASRAPFRGPLSVSAWGGRARGWAVRGCSRRVAAFCRCLCAPGGGCGPAEPGLGLGRLPSAAGKCRPAWLPERHCRLLCNGAPGT